MFLGKLNKDEQTIFMQLSNIIIKSDLEITGAEEKLFFEYESEMGKSFNGYLEKEFNLKDVLSLTEKYNEKAKKVIFFELLGLALCDGNFDNLEQNVIEKIRTSFSISVESQKDMIATIGKLMKLYTEISEYFE